MLLRCRGSEREYKDFSEEIREKDNKGTAFTKTFAFNFF